MPSDRIRSMLDRFAEELEEVVRAEVQERLRNVADGMGSNGRGKASAPVYLKGRKNIPLHCKHGDCKKPHLGPRYGYFCKEHMPEQYLRPGPRSKAARASAQPGLTSVPETSQNSESETSPGDDDK